MTDSTYSTLMAYFQYQRDIGVEDVIFDRESNIVKILSDVSNHSATKGGVAATGGDSRYNAHEMSLLSKTAPDGYVSGGISSLSKLSKLKTVAELGLRKLERVAPIKTHSIKREKLATLYKEVNNCDRCALSKNRNKVVFGSGSADGKLFVIGSAPSLQDEAANLPFQGDIGELFGRIIDKMGLDAKRDIFATYLQKCVNNSNNNDINGNCEFDLAHAKVCRSILDRQIEIVEPKAILIFERTEANFLLGISDDIEEMRASKHQYGGVPAVVTYGLSLMLKETQYRRGAWEDMQKIMRMIKE